VAIDPFHLQHDLSSLGRRASVRRPDDDISWLAGDVAGVGWLRRGVTTGQWLTFAVVLGIALLGVGLRLFQIQVINGERYRLAAEGNRIRTVVTPAPRGVVRDRYGVPLVENQPSFALYLTPTQLPEDVDERDQLLARVAELLPTSTLASLEAAASSTSYLPQLVAEDLPHNVAVTLLAQTDDLPGVDVVAEATRRYIDGVSLAPVVGYVRKISAEELETRRDQGYRFTDRIGTAGLERQYEDVLRGQNGEELIEVDAHGRSSAIVGRRVAVPGRGIQLNLDAELQRVLYTELSRAAAGKPAAAVALNPTDGGVLALVSLPSYDANMFSGVVPTSDLRAVLDDPGLPLFNRAISAQYPSGSTIKPILVAAGLETGVITPQTTVNSVGGISVGRWFFPDWKAGGHGVTDAVKALAESVNTFFYMVGGGWGDVIGLGPERMALWLERFGWGRALGIDLPGEANGVVPTPAWKAQRSEEPWYIGDTYHMAIGQGDILATPLQVAAATAAVANGGTLYKPQVVAAVADASGVLQQRLPQVLGERLASLATLDVVRRGMRAVVTDGSARRLASLPITVAGKTGTAQVADGLPHAWFTAFAPYEQPSIVLAIVVEHGGEGSSVATPVAEAVLRWWAERPAR
jgi:penicillin-binding protein 2